MKLYILKLPLLLIQTVLAVADFQDTQSIFYSVEDEINVHKPSTTAYTNCVDTIGKWTQPNGKKKSCRWVKKKKNKRCKTTLPWEKCPKTCGSCKINDDGSICWDTQGEWNNPQGKKRTCLWVFQKRRNRCKKIWSREFCPSTCNFDPCPNDITPTKVPSISPTTSATTSPSTIPTKIVTISPVKSPTTTPTATPTASPTTTPSGSQTQPPVEEPTVSPNVGYYPTVSPSLWFTQDELMIGGSVAFVSQDKLELKNLNTSPASQDFGVVLTTHAYNDGDIDLMAEYNQLTFGELGQEGYESQIILFFARTGTYCSDSDMRQDDNNFGSFHSSEDVIGSLQSKIFTRPANPIDNTWFYTRANGETQSKSTSNQMTSVSLRLVRSENQITGFFRGNNDGNSDNEAWIQVGASIEIPLDLVNVPLQGGIRVKKEWQSNHQFTVQSRLLSGGDPIDIVSNTPSVSPSVKTTPINPGTDPRPPACPSEFDGRLAYPYEMRGIGGGGAMSGLSISHWDDNLWFVGTDMGTLFRSQDGGQIWYPVSHYEARFTSRLNVAGPVGFTSNPDIILFSSCPETLTTYSSCVALRSEDSGLTWSAVRITDGDGLTSDEKPILDYIPKQWVGSMILNSQFMLVTTIGGGIYRSTDDGETWAKVPIADSHTEPSVGLYLDESISPAIIYAATEHGIYLWQDGAEESARQILSVDASTSAKLMSFTGSRSALSGRLTLTYVDSDEAACSGNGDKDCGYVTIYSKIITPEDALLTEYVFITSLNHAYRVVSSPEDADSFYSTGARSWPGARGTAVWLSNWNEATLGFEQSLVFLQSDVDNGYAKWEKMDHSGVGLDVGYWDGGYYTFAVNAKNSAQAGGSGNFFLHVTRNKGEWWESPFTEHADSCNTDGVISEGERWRSTGLEMTSVRWLRFNPYNTERGYASVADIRLLRTLDSGETFLVGGDGLSNINTLYDFAFAGPHTVFAVGGNFHDWPHEWYKNVRRGAGGVFVSFDSGDTWRRLGKKTSMNCNILFVDTDCDLGDDMVRQILSITYNNILDDGTLYIGTQSSGVARLKGLESIIHDGTYEELDNLEWEWINDGLGNPSALIIPELKIRGGNLYCLLTNNAPTFTAYDRVGIYKWDGNKWVHHTIHVTHPPDVGDQFKLLAYPTSFEIDNDGNMWLVDIETDGNYLASGVWKSIDSGSNWVRLKQFTFAYHVTSIGDRIYVSGARSISRWGHAGWGDGGMFHSSDGGDTWIKNENIPLLGNGNSVVQDPKDENSVFYTFFGGGLLHGPRP